MTASPDDVHRLLVTVDAQVRLMAAGAPPTSLLAVADQLAAASRDDPDSSIALAADHLATALVAAVRTGSPEVWSLADSLRRLLFLQVDAWSCARR